MVRTFTRRQLLLIGVTLALAGCASQTQGLPAAISTTQATPTVPISGTQAISGATTTPTTATQPGSTTGIKIDYMKGVPASTNLNGAGATFPELLYKRWFADFSKLTGTKINYQGVGSGAGINQYTQGTVDFGASDAFLTDAQLAKAPGTLEIPMTAGSISVIVNIPELSSLKSGQLKLTGDTLAGVYLGTITKWNDPKIKADNPDLDLPAQDIVRARRSDGSGTTFNFTSYLSAVSEEWKSKLGAGTTVEWDKVGQTLGASGNAGVAGIIKQNAHSIGYVEQAYARQNSLIWTAMKNKAGKFIEPTLDATRAAIAGLQIPDDYRVLAVNSPDPNAYPIAALTWILVNQQQKDATKGKTLAYLLWWCLHEGQAIPGTGDLEYAKLPDTLIARLEKIIMTIHGPDGKPFIS